MRRDGDCPGNTAYGIHVFHCDHKASIPSEAASSRTVADRAVSEGSIVALNIEKRGVYLATFVTNRFAISPSPAQCFIFLSFIFGDKNT